MIQVRRLKPEDLDYIFKNASELGFVQEKMIHKLEHMMVVIESGSICGIGFFVTIEGKCALNWITVMEQHRRSRLGTMLVKTMLNTAEHSGALQAFIYGICDDFSEFLGFQEILEDKEIIAAKALYEEAYHQQVNGPLYKVSLLDYFKPCGCSPKCN